MGQFQPGPIRVARYRQCQGPWKPRPRNPFHLRSNINLAKAINLAYYVAGWTLSRPTVRFSDPCYLLSFWLISFSYLHSLSNRHPLVHVPSVAIDISGLYKPFTSIPPLSPRLSFRQFVRSPNLCCGRKRERRARGFPAIGIWPFAYDNLGWRVRAQGKDLQVEGTRKTWA